MSVDDRGTGAGTLPGAIAAGIIRLASRRVPAQVREELREEWIAELVAILHDSPPPTWLRGLCGVRFALGLLITASGIGRSLGGAVPTPGIARRRSPELAYVTTDLPLTVANGFQVEAERWRHLRTGVSVPRPHEWPRRGI